MTQPLDLENPIPNHLAKLARDIAYYGLNQRVRRNYFEEGEVANYSNPKFHYDGPVGINGKQGYRYNPYARDGRTPVKAGEIIFYDLRVKGIDGVDPKVGSLQAIDVPGTTKMVQVDEYINSTPTTFQRTVSVENEKTESKEYSFGQMVSTEFSVQMERSAGIKIKAIDAGAKLTTTLTAKAEATASQAFSKSTKLSEIVADSYTVAPWQHWTLVTERSIKNVKQDVWVTGLLDCSVRIHSSHYCMADYDSLDDIWGYFRNIQYGGNKFGDLIRRSKTPRSIVDRMAESVKVTINCPIKAKRARYSKMVSKQTPISH